MQARSIGIGKRELLEDYYPDELDVLFEEWGVLNGVERVEEARVSPAEFLGM